MSEESLLKRRLDREINARKSAEKILEQKAIELYDANIKLKSLNETLEKEVEKKSNQLVENELRYKSLVDEATDSIFNFSSELKISYANSKTLELFGISSEKLLGTHISELVRPDYLDYATAFLEQFWEEEDPETYVELPLIHLDKDDLWSGINITYVQDSTGNYFSAIVRNISERKRVEANLEKAVLGLERSEHKYRGILKNMQLGIVEVDSDNLIEDSNHIFQEMIGYNLEELRNNNPNDLYVAKENSPLVHESNLANDSGIYPVYDVSLIHKTGRPIHVLISMAPIYNLEGEVTGSIAIHYDITERQQLQEKLREAKELAENARRAEQKFLAVMTHEIRTPLNAILGMSHLLSDTTLNTDQSEYVKLIKNAADMLQVLVSDILDFSKIQAGKLNVNNETFDLITHLDNCLKTLAIKHSDPNVKLYFKDNDLHKLWVHSDKKLIHQIVINLLDNALKFTHQGEIVLEIKKHTEGKVLLSVTDTGIGIAKEKLEIIFREFEQADDQIHGTYGGTGLGLSICLKLANLLGTTLTVESQEGIGTTFSLVLDLQENIPISEASTVQEKTKDISRLKILVAEDNPMNQKYITKLLEKKQISYELAENGVVAVRKASVLKYDLIFMDLHMPEMDGYQATTAIKSKGKNVETPVVALTASTMQSQKDEAYRVGMVDFLAKPFTPHQLYTLLGEYSSEIFEGQSEDNSSASNGRQINEDLIREFLGDDIEYQNEMFQIFLDSVSPEIAGIEGAFSRKDLSQVNKLLHKIKPTFRMVGLQDTFEIIQDIEKAAAKGQTDVLDKKDTILKEIEIGMDLVTSRIQKS